MFFNQERPDGEDEDVGSMMYHQFSSGMLDHDGFEDLLLAPHLQQPVLSTAATATTATTADTPPPLPHPPSTSKKICRRRGARKDRHSKIVTAQGTRDRRMRLSLDVAKKFFDLQDLLGFDKASKTVEWLLTKSSKAIKAMKTTCSRSDHSKSSTTDFEVNSTSAMSLIQQQSAGTKSIHLEQHNIELNHLSMEPGSSSWVPPDRVIICEQEEEEDESGGNKSSLPVEVEGDNGIIKMVSSIANEEISTPIFINHNNNSSNNNMDGNDNSFFSIFPDNWNMYCLLGNDIDGN